MPNCFLGNTLDQLPKGSLNSTEFSAAESEIIVQLVGHTITEVEREFILATLVCCCGNRTCAANILDISIRALRNKIRAYTESGLTVPKPGQVPSHECGPVRNMFQQSLRSPSLSPPARKLRRKCAELP
jgi:DNA-binding protein Fis